MRLSIPSKPRLPSRVPQTKVYCTVPLNCCGPLGIDGSAVAADTLQLDLNLSREVRAVEGKSRGGGYWPIGTRGAASATFSAITSVVLSLDGQGLLPASSRCTQHKMKS